MSDEFKERLKKVRELSEELRARSAAMLEAVNSAIKAVTLALQKDCKHSLVIELRHHLASKGGGWCWESGCDDLYGHSKPCERACCICEYREVIAPYNSSDAAVTGNFSILTAEPFRYYYEDGTGYLDDIRRFVKMPIEQLREEAARLRAEREKKGK